MNLLKAYYARVPNLGARSGNPNPEVRPAILATTAQMLSSVVPSAAAEDREEEDVSGVFDWALHPRLKNSEMLADLSGLVGHLSEKQGRELTGLTAALPSLF